MHVTFIRVWSCYLCNFFIFFVDGPLWNILSIQAFLQSLSLSLLMGWLDTVDFLSIINRLNIAGRLKMPKNRDVHNDVDF